MDEIFEAAGEFAVAGAGDSGGGGGRGVAAIVSRGFSFRVSRRDGNAIFRNARGLVS